MVTPLMITSLAAMAATGVNVRADEKLSVEPVLPAVALNTKLPVPFVRGDEVKVILLPEARPVKVFWVPSGSVSTAVASRSAEEALIVLVTVPYAAALKATNPETLVDVAAQFALKAPE